MGNMAVKRARQQRPPRHLPRRGEEGFSLVEVVIAATVILIVMLSVGAVLIDSLGSVAFATQSQGADHLLDKTLEEVRALPFSTLESGLYQSDRTIASDPAISSGQFQGRTLLMSTSQPPAPLYPHQTTVQQSSTSAGTYTVDVYPTAYSGTGPSGVVQVTVVVSWNRAARNGLGTSISGQTLVYSPSAGCLSPSDHPFAAPCQPFLYANATTGGGGITITPDGLANGLGSVLTSAEVTAPSASVDLQSEQIASVSSSAVPPGYLIDTGSGPTSYGGGAVNSYADNDPGTSSNTYSSNQGPGAANSSQTVTAPSGVSLTLGGSGGINGSSAVAATSAGATQQCTDLSGNAVTTGLPCGYASSGTGSGLALSATLGVPIAGSTVKLILLSASENVAAFAGRAVTSGASFCKTTSGDGCVHAGTSRAAFTLGVGGLPTGLLSSLLGWTGDYLQISTGDSTSAESGINPASPQAGPGISVSYYSPSLFKYVPLPSGTLPVPLNISGLLNLQPVNVAISVQDLSVGSATTTSTSCSGATSCEKATVTSPVTGDLSYTVTAAGTEVFGATIHIDLGTETSSTSYKVAPVAG